MAGIGGPLESVTINGRYFSVVGDSDGTRKEGGDENEVSANGDGTARILKTRVPWEMGSHTLSIDDDNSDQEYLQSIADLNRSVPMVFTFASGADYSGSGTITGEIAVNNLSTSASVSFAGQFKLTKN